MTGRLFGLIVSFAVLAACSKPDRSKPGSGDQPTNVTAESVDAAAKVTFAGKKFRDSRGVVKGFGDDRKSIKIAHDEIPDFAKATTTTFPVMAPYVLDGIAEGDRVEFTFSEEFDKSLGGILIHKIAKR